MKEISLEKMQNINGGDIPSCLAASGLSLIFLAGLVTGPAGWAIIGLSGFSWAAIAGAAAGGCASGY
jgi:bacteriocin-like protein